MSAYYTFTPSAAYLLSLVSGVSQEKIESSYIYERDITHPYPFYSDPYYGGVTLPHGNGYSITYTNNLFDDNRFGQDYDAWLDISSHEVGHIKHIDKIRAGKEENSSFQLLSYLSMFLCSYISDGGHDESSLEKEANKGSERYKDFKSFVEQEYGKDAINSLFEKEISEEERINNIRIWWEDYKNKD